MHTVRSMEGRGRVAMNPVVVPSVRRVRLPSFGEGPAVSAGDAGASFSSAFGTVGYSRLSGSPRPR